MANLIKIKKEVGKPKDAFRLVSESSIPKFLKGNAIKVIDDLIEIYSLEGVEVISISTRPVIAFEKIDPKEVSNANKLIPSEDGTYWNVWWKKNADTTLIEKEGKFYTIESIVDAMFVTEEYPSFLGDNIKIEKTNDGWDYYTSWSTSPLHATINKGFWVKYSEGDFNFVEMGTKSANDYIVCDENGEKICSLNEYFKKLNV